MEEFSGSGFWWMADSPEATVFGTVSYDHARGFSLEIPAGTLGPAQDWVTRVNKMGALDDASVGTVLGQLQNGKSVTLFDCQPAGFTLSMPGMPRESFHSSAGAVGAAHLSDGNEIARVRLALDYLADWANYSDLSFSIGFDEHDKGDGTFGIHRKPVDPLEVIDTLDLSIRVINETSSSGGPLHGFTVAHKCVLEIDLATPIHHGSIDATVLTPLSGFLVLALDCAVSVRGVQITSTGSTDWMELGYSYGAGGEPQDSRLQPWMLLPLPSETVDVRQLLARWLTLEGDARHAARLLVSLVAKDSIGLDSRLMLCAQALESVHRVACAGDELDRDEFRARLQAVKACELDVAVKTWALQKLCFANNKTLASQLEELCQYAGPIVERIAPDQARFVRDLRRGRNFFAHGDESRGKPLDGIDLYWLTEAATLLLRACVLRLLDVDPTAVETLMVGAQGCLQSMVRTSRVFASGEGEDLADAAT